MSGPTSHIDRFEQHCKSLREFIVFRERLPKLSSQNKEERKLAKWVSTQRSAQDRGKLSDERAAVIHNINNGILAFKETKIDAFLLNRMKDHNTDRHPHTSNSTKAETKPRSKKKPFSVKKDNIPATNPSQAIPMKEKCSIDGCNSNAAEGGVCCKHGGKRIKNKKICTHDGCTKDSYRGGVCWKHGGRDNRNAGAGDTKLQSIVGEERMKDIMEGMWSEQQSTILDNNFMGEGDNDGEDDEEEDSCNQKVDSNNNSANSEMLPPAWIVELNEKEDQGVLKKRKRDGQLHQTTRQSDDYSSAAVSNNHQFTTSSNNLAALDAAYRQYINKLHINKLQSEYNLDSKDVEYLASRTVTKEDIEQASKRQRTSTDTNNSPANTPVAEEKKPKHKRYKALKSYDEKWMDKYNALVEYYKVNGANAPVPKETKPLYGW